MGEVLYQVTHLMKGSELYQQLHSEDFNLRTCSKLYLKPDFREQ
jgi:hypothetical protein